KLVSAFSSLDTKFFYACKALTNINILKYIDSLGCGIDCSSVNEVKLAIHAGVPKEKILYTSNGISFEEIEEVASQGVHLNIDTVRNIKDANVFVNVIKVLSELVPHFTDLNVIDLGGGFKVPYEPGDEETDMNLIARKLKTFLDSHLSKDGKKYQLWFEPGKYLVSECGYLITKVNVVKDNIHQIFVGVDTGLNHLVRPMMYDAYHHIVNISNPDAQEKAYTVTGYICETDTFASDRLLHEVREGDYLVFYNAGAYGFEMSSHYNSRYKPAEVLVKDGKASLIRKPDNFDTLLR